VEWGKKVWLQFGNIGKKIGENNNKISFHSKQNRGKKIKLGT